MDFVNDFGRWRLWPVEERIVFSGFVVTAAVLLVVPSDGEQRWVSLAEAVPPAAAEADYEYSEEHAEENIGAPSLLDRTVAEVVAELQLIHLVTRNTFVSNPSVGMVSMDLRHPSLAWCI